MNFENYMKYNGIYYKTESNYIFEDEYEFNNGADILICFTLKPDDTLTEFKHWFTGAIITEYKITYIKIQTNDVMIEYEGGTWDDPKPFIKLDTSYFIQVLYDDRKKNLKMKWFGKMISELVIGVSRSNGLQINSCITVATTPVQLLNKIKFYFEEDTIYTNNNLTSDEKKLYIKQIISRNSTGGEITTKTHNWGNPQITLSRNIGLIIDIENKDNNVNDNILKYLIVEIDNTHRITSILNDIVDKLQKLDQTIYY